MSTKANIRIYYSETQYFRQRWLLLILLVISAIAWYAFVSQIILGYDVGSQPGQDWMIWITWLAAGIGLPLLLYIIRLVVTVQEDQIEIKFYPLLDLCIEFESIHTAKQVEYSPIREFGGWGIRWGGKNKRAYNMSGNQGVELTMNDGKSILIGSQDSAKLAAIINREMRRLRQTK
jgi:hypothetical protein